MSKSITTLRVGVDRRQFLTGALGIAALAGASPLLAACSRDGSPKAASTSSGATRAKGSIAIRAVSDLKTNLGASGYLLQFQKNIEASSNGEVAVQYFSYQELDTTYPTLVTQAKSGRIQMVAVISTYLFDYFPELQALSLPFLFKDMDSFNKIMDGAIGKEIIDYALSAKGLRLTPFSSQSFIQLPNKRQPIQHLEDVKGLKVRVQSAGVLTDSLTALGAVPQVIDIAELYTSLQTNAVQGAAINDNTVISYKLAPVLPYFSELNLTPNIKTILMNDDWFKGLDPDIQKLVNDAAASAAKSDHTAQATLASTAGATMQSQGVKINTVADADLASFRTAVAPVWTKGRTSYGATAAKWIDEIQNAS